MIYEEKKFFDPENQWDRVPEWGDVAEHTDEATEVLDATTKTQLWDLALKVDVMNDNKEEEFSDIDALFWAEGKINQLDDAKKNDALKYALKDAKIKMWSWEISVIKIAELFWKYVSQDGNWWRLSVSEIPEGDDKQYEEALRSLISSPTQSPLAYLIQKTSNFAKIQAENGYGRETEANKLREIREDKALGNQTRRALAWLRSWVEWWKIEEEKIPDLKVDDVLKMKYISKETMEAIKEKSTDENVKKLWDDLGKEDSKYEYRVPYTNNYALKLKWETEETLSNGNVDVSGITPEKETINEIEREVYMLDDLSKLPEDWKWSNEKIVYWFQAKDVTVAWVTLSNVRYKFLNDGTCYKEIKAGSTVVNDWPYDSVTIINKLKAPEYTSDNITTEEMKNYVETVKTQCAEALKINDNESLWVTFEWKKIKFTLWSGETVYETVWWTQYWATMSVAKDKLLSESFDIKDCLKGWNVDDQEYWNINIEYIEKVLIKKAKEKLVNEKKAIQWSKALVNKYSKKENWFTLKDLFEWDAVLQNTRKEWRLKTFFSKFDDEKLVLDSDTTYSGSIIKLEFDDSWWNEDYNKWDKNGALKINASEIVKDDYSIDEGKFKSKLKTIILSTIEREDFK